MEQPETTATWPNESYLRQHFQLHRARLRVRTVAGYDASARETIRRGVRFTYTDIDSGQLRVGYFDAERSRLTALSSDERRIISHFRATEYYVRSLPDSDY